jgi:signal transduction histidine kinase
MDDDRTARSLREQVSAGRPQRPLPLAMWAALLLVGTVVVMLAVVGLVLHAQTHRMHIGALLSGLGVGLLAIGGGAYLAHTVGRDIRRLTLDATERASDRGTSAPLLPITDRMRELHQVAALLDALQLRARVAEELAEQAQRTSHTASAGMFELLSGLVAAEEATRGQLSADLHDTVAQTLSSARSILANPEGQPGAWERVRELIEDAEEELRAAMARTRPPELRDSDLGSAVAALRRELAARYLLEVKLGWPVEPHPVPLVSAVTVYRFFQEALLNVVKHADVDEAEATLTIQNDMLIATVHDAGPGFDPEEVRSVGGRHVGIGLLRERARLAGGTVDIETGPGAGTTLTLRLPARPRVPQSGNGHAEPVSDQPSGPEAR